MPSKNPHSRGLYEILAAEYRNLFPSSEERRRLLEEILEEYRAGEILDIGCASGELASQMAGDQRRITGIDLDGAMIEEAQRSHGERRGLHFEQADMVDYLARVPGPTFDGILCLGNTLVYLDGVEALDAFLPAVMRALKDQGFLLIQILNYKNPSLGPGFSFPPLEGERVRFERAYREGKKPPSQPSDRRGPLEFQTRVTDKRTGETHGDSHTHYPFLSEEILQRAKAKGFLEGEIYGDYHRKPPEETDFFHLILLRKGSRVE